MSARPDGWRALPALPADDDGPVFSEPWQAQAFAMVVELHARGRFTWGEWAAALAAEIAAAGPGDTTNYWRHWLAALETLVAAKQLASSDEQARRRDAWERAAEATPHGRPIDIRPFL
ncbi:MAG: nitrile hydratase accessory protein [Alphaproteobacteria bacterium]|nr:nitrile hydratase accessory protein [Alphaproteobacteria bacterium]